MTHSARLIEGGGVQSLFGQCPNRPCVFLSGASLSVYMYVMCEYLYVCLSVGVQVYVTNYVCVCVGMCARMMLSVIGKGDVDDAILSHWHCVLIHPWWGMRTSKCMRTAI